MNPKSETQVNQTINYATSIAVTIDDIKQGTVTNPVICKVIKIMKNECWYESDKLLQGHGTNELKQYGKIKYSLSLNDQENIILKDTRIVIPRCFEINVVSLAHIGYQGLVKTKSLFRRKVFFLNMDNMDKMDVFEHEQLPFFISC